MTRQELYELVWSAPMAAVAEQLGISDKSVTKRCQTHGVPTPPRGYWTQVAINRAAPKPPLEGDPTLTIPTAQDLAYARAAKAGAPATARPTVETLPPNTPSCAVADGSVASLDMAMLRALAADMQAHDAMIALVDRVATRAMRLPAEKARLVLQWVATTRGELVRLDPAAAVLSTLQVG